MAQRRTQKGTPAGGEFAGTTHDESDVTLSEPGDEVLAEIAAWAAEKARLEAHVVAAQFRHDTAKEHLEQTVFELAEAGSELAVHRRLGVLQAQAAGMRAWEKVLAGTGDGSSAGWHVSVDGNDPDDNSASGTPPTTEPLPSTHPFVRHGGVADQVIADDVVYHRRREGVYADWPYSMRFQADRTLTDAEMAHAAQLIGWNYKVNVRGESMDAPVRDSPYSFVVAADTTKTQSDDIGRALERFEDNFQDLIENGSEPRKTDRSGPGTKGTRLVEPLGPVHFEIYYDQVTT